MFSINSPKPKLQQTLWTTNAQFQTDKQCFYHSATLLCIPACKQHIVINIQAPSQLKFSQFHTHISEMRSPTQFYLAICFLTTLANCLPEEDRVTTIPELPHSPKFAVFSGYLDATPGNHLHYFFTAAEDATPETPVMVWFNGGPGCSSLLGLLTENGPFRIKADKNSPGPIVDYFDRAWNKVAHMLFIESPVGVGFSYKVVF